MSQINYHNVEVRQQETIVLENVNFNIQAGEFVYLIGKVGSGKSSLLKTMYGELDIHSGRAEVLGYDMTHIRRKQIPALRKRIGIVFQDFQLLTDRNVKDNLDFVLKATGCSDKRKRQLRIEEVLELVGMQTKGYKMPHELSGGEQQRIVIARAILNTPDIILADEPTGNLDPETGHQIVELLCKICNNGSTVIMTTHNLQLLEEFPGKVFRCENHQVVEQVTQAPQEIEVQTEEEPQPKEVQQNQEDQVPQESIKTQEVQEVKAPLVNQQHTESQEFSENIDVQECPEYLKSLESLIPQEPKDNNQ
jgi:cell division transport system ATP-binding protein